MPRNRSGKAHPRFHVNFKQRFVMLLRYSWVLRLILVSRRFYHYGCGASSDSNTNNDSDSNDNSSDNKKSSTAPVAETTCQQQDGKVTILIHQDIAAVNRQYCTQRGPVSCYRLAMQITKCYGGKKSGATQVTRFTCSGGFLYCK